MAECPQMDSALPPDDLTDREHEVLELVRMGLTNEEIAARLGISLDGAKYHVSQILSKLGVASRAEAAGVVSRPQRWGFFAWPVALRIAAVGTMLATAAVVGGLAWGVAKGGSGDREPNSPSGDVIDDPQGLEGHPLIGEDHWHAAYTFYACGVKQPNAPTWDSGIHTHGDGIIHLHPFTESEEGRGARLVKWFEYGDGLLDDSQIRLPGSSHTYANGDVCPDDSPEAGETGEVQVFVNGEKLDEWGEYIPEDGDRIRMMFGPPNELAPEGHVIIPESEASRTIELGIAGSGETSQFQIPPEAVSPMSVGETVRLVLQNNSDSPHGLRVAGADGLFGTADDFVAYPVGTDPTEGNFFIDPQQEGVVVVRFDEPGTYAFDDPLSVNPSTQESYAVGTIIVTNAPTPTPTPPPPTPAG